METCKTCGTEVFFNRVGIWYDRTGDVCGDRTDYHIPNDPPFITQDQLEDMRLDDRWGGFGYIGGRLDLKASERRRADALVLTTATALGWDVEQLFEWANSKLGRWFTDHATWGFTDDDEGLKGLIRTPD